MSKYGPPVKCEICQQTCAFNRSDLRIDGKLHCWLCKLSYKRALAKAKKSDIDKHRDRAKKRPADDSHKTSGSSLKIGNQGSNRNSNNSGNSRDLSKSTDIPDSKISKTSNVIAPSSHNTDHVVALTQLREQIATLQKKLQQKDSQLLQKDKEVSDFSILFVRRCKVINLNFSSTSKKSVQNLYYKNSFPSFFSSEIEKINSTQITEWKGKHFSMENEMRNKMTEAKKVFDAKIDFLNKKVQTQQVQIAQLGRATGKRTTNVKETVKEREKDNNNSSPNNSDSPNTN